MNYKINRYESYWEIEAEKVISIKDCCYDVINDNFVIAVECNKDRDYIVINREQEIVRTLSEKQGMNRKFVLSPDKSVWVGMDSLCTEKNGEIILPLYDRSRVTKEIVKSSLGVDYSFFWKDCYWGYVVDFFGDKPDKMLQYQFDKKSLYKSRKAYKLEGMYNARPYVQDESLYLCQKEYKNNELHILKMTEPGNPEKVCEPIFVGELEWCRMVNVDATGYKLIGIENNDIYIIKLDSAGGVIDKKCIYSIEIPAVHSIMNFKVSEEGIIAFSYVGENQSGIIEIKDNVAKCVFCQKNNVLYADGLEIPTENRFAFNIMTDGKKNYYMASNITCPDGKSKKIYVVEG